MRGFPFARIVLVALWAASCVAITLGLAQDVRLSDTPPSSDTLRDGFEGQDAKWVEEGGDVTHRIRFHAPTTISAHSGVQSEGIGVTAGKGTHLYFGYSIGRAVVADELRISLWLKSDRPGSQLLARVVFPRERDPDTLQLLSTLAPGTIYDQPGKWQRLELSDAARAMERQARLLRAALKRNVDTREAYIDRVLVNVYGGPGDTDVLLDDLEVSPVMSGTVDRTAATLQQPSERAGPAVEVSQDRLLIEGRPRLLRAIHAPGVSRATLAEFGFNAVTVDWPIDTAAAEEAVTSRLWLVPRIPDQLADADPDSSPFAQALGTVPFRDAVLFWYLGSQIPPEALKSVQEAVKEIRRVSPPRPIAGDVTGNFWAYSRELEMVGAHRLPIGSSLGLRDYREWLSQRRYSARPGTYFFTWLQVSGNRHDGPHPAVHPGAGPDQLRLLTFSAIASGCRGLAYWADEKLGTAGMGRQQLLALGLLNLELQLLEPYLASSGSVQTLDVEIEPQVVQRGPGAEPKRARSDFGRGGGAPGFAHLGKGKASSHADREEVQATLLRNDRGLVVIPVWYGKGAQFVAGQFAANDLTMVIPGIPDAAQAWQITPAEIRQIKRERVAGGTRLTIPEFDLTSIVLITSDANVLAQMRRDIVKTRALAALWAAELANNQFDQTARMNSTLQSIGYAQPDGAALLQSAKEHLAACRDTLVRNDYAASYAESQRAIRALRVLERAHWEEAAKGLAAPQCSPYGTAFATLAEHWRLMADVRDAQFSGNLISGGDFESAAALASDGWTQRQDGGDGLELKATLSAQVPHGGSRSLHLQLAPRNDTPLAAAVLEPTLMALVSKPIPVRAGEIVRIRFWLRIPSQIQGTTDGAMLYDSIGGTALAIARTEPLEWKQYTLFRRVESSGDMSFTIGLTGIGDMYLDDLEVARMSGGAMTQRHKPSAARK